MGAEGKIHREYMQIYLLNMSILKFRNFNEFVTLGHSCSSNLLLNCATHYTRDTCRIQKCNFNYFFSVGFPI